MTDERERDLASLTCNGESGTRIEQGRARTECFVCIVVPRQGLASVATQLFAQEGATAWECTCPVLDLLWPIGGCGLVKQEMNGE
jgi:hypothetical protein